MRSIFNKQNPLLLFEADGSNGAGKTEDALLELEREKEVTSDPEEVAEEKLQEELDQAKTEAQAAEKAEKDELAEAQIKANESEFDLERYKSKLVDPKANLEDMEKALNLDGQSEEEYSNLDSKKKVEQEAKPEDSVITIDDDYIKAQPEELQVILKGIHGDQVSPRVLKNYTNAQLHLAQLKQKAEEEKEDVSLEEMLGYNEDTKKEEQPKSEEKMITQLSHDEITAKRNELALKRIQQKYPDFPDDGLSNKETMNDYYRDMMDEKPAEYDDFKDYVNRANTDATISVKNKVELARNWKTLAGKSVDDAVEQFSNFLDSKGLSEQDLEINLRDPKLLKTFLYDQNGRANEDVVFYNEGVPMIATNQLVKTLKDAYYDKIIDVKANLARNDGFGKRKSFEPGPSISGAAVKGRSTVKTEIPKEITPYMSIEQMEEVLNKTLKEAEDQIR